MQGHHAMFGFFVFICTAPSVYMYMTRVPIRAPLALVNPQQPTGGKPFELVRPPR